MSGFLSAWTELILVILFLILWIWFMCRVNDFEEMRKDWLKRKEISE